MSELRTVRGMRDLMVPEILVQDYLVETAVRVFRQFGYEPLDSPVMELWETLSAKGGEEVEAETFKFKDKGDREVGLRFDLTVPLARIVASNPTLPKPFKRYAIGKAWRYDRPQAGRYREFMQADVDVVGSASPAADAEVVLVALEFLRRVLGSDYVIKINSRKVLKGLTERANVPDGLAHECFRAIDKLDKIGVDGVRKELHQRGIGAEGSDFLLEAIKISGSGRSTLDEFQEVLGDSTIGQEGVEELELMADIFAEAGVEFLVQFDLSLARGLDYYTGPVFEGRYLGKPAVGSVLGGGRYDKLIEKFGGPPTPATGISLGISRFIDILMARGKGEELMPRLDIFVAPIKRPMLRYAVRFQQELIRAGFSCEVDLMERSLKKQLERADAKRARLVLIVGPRDIAENRVSLRDMVTKETVEVPTKSIVEEVRKILLDK
ncbi:MAG: histidine--tRNA ligase [Candidatus Thorarchaeota archaeon]